MRLRPTLGSRAGWLAAVAFVILVMVPGTALGQAGPEYTPATSVTPTKIVQPWIYQMAIAALILGVLIVLGVAFSYLRFSPKFFGREEPPKPLPPGTRPPLLARQAPVRAVAPPPAAAAAPASAPSMVRSAAATATAVAERPPVTAEPEAPSGGEPSEGSEPREEVQTAPAQAANPPVEAAPPQAALPQAALPQAAPPQAATHGGPAPLDQETFDRVLAEQLEKGVDRRVAEGRARAAAVVAARKKAQG